MKLLINIFFILLIASLAITLQTCKPDDDVNKTYGPYTLGEARDYIDFKPGSWWVYQNNKSGLYDTLVLKSISIRSKTFTGKNTVIKDMVNMLIYSTTTKYEYEYYTFGANPDAKPEYLERANFISLIFGKSKAGDYQGETVPFFYPFDSSSTSGTGSHTCYYDGFYSSFNLKTKTYNYIQKFYLDQDNTWDRASVNYYWAKDVGLIKKENIKKGESWDLVNFNTMKP
jgi:hypothetical protein